jgi:hypothetical protein
LGHGSDDCFRRPEYHFLVRLMRSDEPISIWFFIGISLLFNGVLILGAGLYQFVHPPAVPVVLFHLHAGIWWGALLLVTGLAYCIRYAPSRG